MTIPTAVCWSGELEWVLMLKDETIDTYLFGLLTDPAKAGYDVSAISLASSSRKRWGGM